MYQSYIYLDVRVLLSAVPEVFLVDYQESENRDINSANKVFLSRNNNGAKVKSVNIEPSVLHKVSSFVKAIGGSLNKDAHIECQTGNIQEPPDDRIFTGFSVKVAEGGSLNIFFHQKSKKIDIEEVRIEEDAGHLTRTGGKARMDWTYAGCPSMRIKTKVELELGEEAELFLEELYTLMTYLKLVTGDLDEACVRCNAFVALAHYPYSPDYFVKLRNLNSFNFVRKAINSELSRQEEVLSAGGKVLSESRLWIAELNTTESWKTRQESSVKFTLLKPDVKVDVLSSSGNTELEVELPAARRERLKTTYGLSRLRTEFICADKDRADYFEEAVAEGADPMMAAHWMAGELMHLLNVGKTSIKQCNVTSKKFASIIKMLYSGKIHSGIAKNLLQEVNENGDNPEVLVKKKNLSLISSEEELKPFVDRVLSDNEKSVSALMNGDMAPLEHLTGCVMKDTGGRAVPLMVKNYIKNQLKISLVYVFTMGGAITAQKHVDGTVAAGEAENIKKLINDEETGSSYPVQVINVRSMLSEETEPADWAALIAQIGEKIQSGTANGIVVTHGTDTLPYTSALLFWLYGSAGVPIVLTASSTLPSEGSEASSNLTLAIKTARERKNGVYVVYGGKLYSPLNLKYCTNNSTDGFVNWNLSENIYTSQSLVSQQFMMVNAPDVDIVRHLLNEAASRLAVVRLYPGLPGYRLEKVYDEESSVDNIILELYASGTCNMRNSDYSLKSFLINGRRRGMRFYCTSQQECKIDFSEYSTSARVWREGAVPMGILTTESVVALFNACYLVADNDAELAELMEAATEQL